MERFLLWAMTICCIIAVVALAAIVAHVFLPRELLVEYGLIGTLPR